MAVDPSRRPARHSVGRCGKSKDFKKRKPGPIDPKFLGFFTRNEGMRIDVYLSKVYRSDRYFTVLLAIKLYNFISLLEKGTGGNIYSSKDD